MGRIVASLIGFLGDFDLAEEAAQEAFAIAAERWPREGEPVEPRAWLLLTARRRALDRVRRDRTLRATLPLLVRRELVVADDVDAIVNDDFESSVIADERPGPGPRSASPRSRSPSRPAGAAPAGPRSTAAAVAPARVADRDCG